MSESQLRIIVADDDDDVRDATIALLATRPEFEVIGSASNGDDALTLARDNPPDVAIIDVRMPGGGEALVTHLRALNAHTAVVAFTAYDDPLVRRRILDAGASAFAIKGATPNLVDVLHAACDAH